MFLRILDRLEETLIASLMAAATLLIFAAVVQRFAAGTALLYPIASSIDLTWAQELCIFMFIWMAKFGAAYGVRTGIHVGVDVLVVKLKPTQKKVVILFSLFCGALFTSVVGTMGALFVYGLMGTGQTTPDLEWPSWLVYLCIPLGSYLMCFRFLQAAYNFWKTGELPHHDIGRVEGVPDVAEALEAGHKP
jgi:C4-dicarboxylate transporter DctQ subunit